MAVKDWSYNKKQQKSATQLADLAHKYCVYTDSVFGIEKYRHNSIQYVNIAFLKKNSHEGYPLR